MTALPQPIRAERIHPLNQRPPAAEEPVFYWMSRDQRAADNWALLHAQREACRRGAPLVTAFCLAPDFLGATLRQYAFMLRGLAETEGALRRLSVSFVLLRGDPGREVPAFAQRIGAGLVVTDFDPLHIKTGWRTAVAGALRVPAVEVDAHNIVPAWHASPKQEYGAYTLRPKLRKLLPDFLTPIPALRRHPYVWPHDPGPADWVTTLGASRSSAPSAVPVICRSRKAAPSVMPVASVSADLLPSHGDRGNRCSSRVVSDEHEQKKNEDYRRNRASGNASEKRAESVSQHVPRRTVATHYRGLCERRCERDGEAFRI